jgi:hypothetical protein
VSFFAQTKQLPHTLKPVGSQTAFVQQIWRGGTHGALPAEPFNIGDNRLANWRHRGGLGG